MSGLARHCDYSFQEYLALEEVSNTKHEFFQGEMYAMAGGTPEHAAICANLIAAFVSQLAGSDCRVFSSDLRVRVVETGLATYPDVTVVCGPLQYDSESAVTVVNPKIVVEVLSNSTELYDRGEKLKHYKALPSLQACVLVSHRTKLLEIHRRRSSHNWDVVQYSGEEVATLDFISCELPLEVLYSGVQLPNE